MIRSLFRRATWLLLMLWCLCLLLVGAKFAQNNSTLLQVDLIFWTAPEVPSGLALSLALLLGVLLGVLMFAPLALLQRARAQRLRALLVKLEANPQRRPLTPLRG